MQSREQQNPQPKSNADDDQRDRLEESEREAAKGGAENYQDDKRDSKVVSTGQDDAEDVGSIKKIDSDEARKTGKPK
ncbi:MAG: hypothetical protein R3E87_26085 [Burkholderiaceae bacterium]